jgi:hypothetical protein
VLSLPVDVPVQRPFSGFERNIERPPKPVAGFHFDVHIHLKKQQSGRAHSLPETRETSHACVTLATAGWDDSMLRMSDMESLTLANRTRAAYAACSASSLVLDVIARTFPRG